MKKNPVKTAIDQATQRLGKEARLVIRASGTEPVIRIMAEGDEREVLNAVVTELTDVISQHDTLSKE
ncbi:phosphomannomutase [Bartonella callosciuri]|uniref:Phosphomannomutase n=1 Tax=Bartonella callosciuri TaxID=686223 RepID=A0A840NTX5_9HYPH|nr:phosphomannomutase [Bartonella callosciuri]